jgi:hypothetical protein
MCIYHLSSHFAFYLFGYRHEVALELVYGVDLRCALHPLEWALGPSLDGNRPNTGKTKIIICILSLSATKYCFSKASKGRLRRTSCVYSVVASDWAAGRAAMSSELETSIHKSSSAGCVAAKLSGSLDVLDSRFCPPGPSPESPTNPAREGRNRAPRGRGTLRTL